MKKACIQTLDEFHLLRNFYTNNAVNMVAYCANGHSAELFM